MKRILFFIFSVIVVATTVKAQLFYTPKGCRVTNATAQGITMDPQLMAYWREYVRLNYTCAEILGDASLTYNCHGYAWHMTEGGSPVWFHNHPVVPLSGHNASIYWEDGSYEEIFFAEPGSKVAYFSDDHSAVVCSQDTNFFISKWGDLPLVRHHRNASTPYSASQLKFFSRVQMNNLPPCTDNLLSAITGSDAITTPGGTGTYSVAGIPSAWTVAWTHSSNIGLSPTTGHTVTATRLSYGKGWIKASIIMLPCPDIGVLTKSICLGTPPPLCLNPSCPGSCHVCEHGDGCEACGGSYPDCFLCPIPCSICFPSWCNCFSPASSGIIVHPNPATDEIMIEFLEERFSDRRQTFSVKLLDGSGRVQRQTSFFHSRRDGKTKSVRFSVSNLPEGTYYLHIEANGEIKRKQIVVKR